MVPDGQPVQLSSLQSTEFDGQDSAIQPSEMDSDKEVNSAKNLTRFSIDDILSKPAATSSDVTSANTPAATPPAEPVVNNHSTYPWFLFNHPSWPLVLPEGSAPAIMASARTSNNDQSGSSSALMSSPEEDDDRLSDVGDELFDRDDDDDDGTDSIIGSLTSTEDGQQEDALDMSAGHHHPHRRNRPRKCDSTIKSPFFSLVLEFLGTFHLNELFGQQHLTPRATEPQPETYSRVGHIIYIFKCVYTCCMASRARRSPRLREVLALLTSRNCKKIRFFKIERKWASNASLTLTLGFA